MRIVSLLPSATEIVCALGLAKQLVGISHSCDYPADILDRPRLSQPVVDLKGLSSGEIDAAVRRALHEHGSVYDIDVAALSALQPDLILTQGICDVCAVPERQVYTSLPGGAQVLTLDAHDLGAIYASIADVGRVTDTTPRAGALVAAMQRRVAAVRARAARRLRPRVLVLEWLDPPYAPGHWVPELVAAAGGDLLAGTARRPSYRMSWDALPQADVVIVMPCGYGLRDAEQEMQRYAERLRALAPRVVPVDAAAFFSRSGPRVVDGLELLEAAIFGEC